MLINECTLNQDHDPKLESPVGAPEHPGSQAKKPQKTAIY
jgi:hypothetical protein